MDQAMLRHLLATLAYRTRVAVRNAPTNYPDFRLEHGVRSPIEILNHMSSLLSYVLKCYGEPGDADLTLGTWEQEVHRFYQLIEHVDVVLQRGTEPFQRSIEVLLQGPISDAFTHVGQLLMLRRAAGAPVPGESYMRAQIQAGDVTFDWK